ncbi:MAG: hypothetical protein ACE363_06325 [Alphaproteobacteria bacterium]
MSKAVIWVGAIVFAGFLVWGFLSGQPFRLSTFTQDPWIIVVVADLYLGFILMAVVIAVVEGSVVKAAPWIIALMIAGNLVAAVYLLLHFARLSAPFSAFREDS